MAMHDNYSTQNNATEQSCTYRYKPGTRAGSTSLAILAGLAIILVFILAVMPTLVDRLQQAHQTAMIQQVAGLRDALYADGGLSLPSLPDNGRTVFDKSHPVVDGHFPEGVEIAVITENGRVVRLEGSSGHGTGGIFRVDVVTTVP